MLRLPIGYLSRLGEQFGQGRAFYSAFGHYKSLYWDSQILAHYLSGIQFALGDLQVDTTPSIA